MYRLRPVCLALSLALLVQPATPVLGAATQAVDCDAGGDLQAALDLASAGATISVSGRCSGTFVIDEDGLELRAGRPGSGLTGTGHGSVVSLLEVAGSQRELKITGLTIEGGGAGVTANAFTTVVLDSVVVRDHGIGLDGQGNSATFVVSDSQLLRNRVGATSGMQGTVSIVRSLVAENGTGISSWNASLVDSVVRDNGPGGGIIVQQFLRVDSSLIDGNHAHDGAGVFVMAGPTEQIEILRTTISNNTADRTGGGLRSGWRESEGQTLLRTVAFRANVAGQGGGAIFHSGGRLTMEDVEFHGNQPDDCRGCRPEELR